MELRLAITRAVAWLILGSATILPCAVRAQAPGLDVRNVWRPVFDGRSTNGWAQVGPGWFEFQNGELITRGGMGLFWYKREKLSNCQVRVMFKPTHSNDNSGVFVRIPHAPTNEWDAVHHGYEVQIADDGDDWHRTGSLYSLTRTRNRVVSKIGEWNEMLITLQGPVTRVHINGVLVTDYSEGDPVPLKADEHEPERGPRPLAGFLGLQNHDTNSVVRFREVSVRTLK